MTTVKRHFRERHIEESTNTFPGIVPLLEIDGDLVKRRGVTNGAR